MKLTIFVWIALWTAAAALAADDPREHAAHHPVVADAKVASADSPSPMKMNERMQEMHALLDKIDATKSPDERARLLETHRRAMREQMEDMKRMGGMMGCHEDMQSRMRMMSDMMEQMMHREEAAQPHH